MNEVLYRKWRPKRLDQVVGQESVIRTLKQAVAQQRIAHAYLFCGPRGTGKTSTARILAKAINCLAPEEGEPDNRCEICVSFNEGRALDLIEIDAASNRGIDDIRNLSDKIRYTPNEARYKVYIVDEVHMLTEHAFNALLKTLEEPPAHAVFVLATTEAHKVPLTVISRCQRYDFRRLSVGSIVEKLTERSKEEGFQVEGEAFRLIARYSTGSLRDAENLLEQLVTSYGATATAENMRDLLELGGDEVALELVDSIVNKNASDGLRLVNDIVAQGNDLRQLLQGVVELLRAVLLIKSNASSSLGYQEETTSKLQSMADATSLTQVIFVLKIFSKVDLRSVSAASLPLELALVEACIEAPPVVLPSEPRVAPSAQSTSTAHPPYTPPRQASAHSQPSHSAPAAAQGNSRRVDSQPSPSPEVLPSGPAGTLESEWAAVIRAMRHTGKRFKLGALLRGCKEREVADDLITLRFLHASHVDRMEEELGDPATRREVQEVFAKVMGKPYDVKVTLIEGGGNGARSNVAQRSHLVRAAQSMGARIVDEKEDVP